MDWTGVILLASSTEMERCTDGELRLYGGDDDIYNGTREGRLEICFNNAWGTVCNASFGIPDARVACGQLVGFHRDGQRSIMKCMLLSFYHVFLLL